MAVAALSLIVSNGLSIGGLPPFYKPLREDFVASGAIAAAHAETFIANSANITFLLSGVFSLVGGWLALRFPLKAVMTAGCILLGSGLILHSAGESVALIYAARALMGSSLGFIGVAPCVVLVSRWFDKGRGTALGITLVGTSLGGALIPLIASPLIENFGWRKAMLALSLLVWLVLLPAVLLLVREPSENTAGAEALQLDGISWPAALRKPIFWALAACSALVFYPIFATSQQFILYLQTPKIGVSAETAAFAQSALFAISIGGKFLAGFASDRFGSVRVMTFCAFLLFAASLVLFDLSAATALYFLLPFALGYGGTFVLIQRLASDLFGRADAGRILGTITLIEVIGAAIGGKITGYLADLHGGDYTVAFYGVTVAAAGAFIAALAVIILYKKQEMGAAKANGDPE
ncbi:MAG: major facilitator superfamily protein [Acidobacteria bacterium OLB17]|nr:MAG: major facilitator superfamily protein [Acidobacteria bacterium OLB17]MCZ2391402.1 MFS transporter [Acidobacteriota bacterium]